VSHCALPGQFGVSRCKPPIFPAGARIFQVVPDDKQDTGCIEEAKSFMPSKSIHLASDIPVERCFVGVVKSS
jgi:hypothetical protein